MSLKINVAEKYSKKTYNDLKPGDVFQFGTNLQAVGLKLNMGHIILEYVSGVNGFEYTEHDNIDDHPILFLGKLTGVEVERRGN